MMKTICNVSGNAQWIFISQLIKDPVLFRTQFPFLSKVATCLHLKKVTYTSFYSNYKCENNYLNLSF